MSERTKNTPLPLSSPDTLASLVASPSPGRDSRIVNTLPEIRITPTVIQSAHEAISSLDEQLEALNPLTPMNQIEQLCTNIKVTNIVKNFLLTKGRDAITSIADFLRPTLYARTLLQIAQRHHLSPTDLIQASTAFSDTTQKAIELARRELIQVVADSLRLALQTENQSRQEMLRAFGAPEIRERAREKSSSPRIMALEKASHELVRLHQLVQAGVPLHQVTFALFERKYSPEANGLQLMSQMIRENLDDYLGDYASQANFPDKLSQVIPILSRISQHFSQLREIEPKNTYPLYPEMIEGHIRNYINRFFSLGFSSEHKPTTPEKPDYRLVNSAVQSIATRTFQMLNELSKNHLISPLGVREIEESLARLIFSFSREQKEPQTKKPALSFWLEMLRTLWSSQGHSLTLGDFLLAAEQFSPDNRYYLILRNLRAQRIANIQDEHTLAIVVEEYETLKRDSRLVSNADPLWHNPAREASEASAAAFANRKLQRLKAAH